MKNRGSLKYLETKFISKHSVFESISFFGSLLLKNSMIIVMSCLFVSSANATSFNVNFSLCHSTLATKELGCASVPLDAEVLSYNSGQWIPKPINGLSYQGSWDAANDPIPNVPPAGNYFIVSDANSPYNVGDWIVSNGSSFDRIDNSQAVTSVFGNTGVIIAREGDYNLTKLGDVTIASPATNEVLTFNGTTWVNATETDPTVSAFAKIALPNCGVGQVLKSNGSVLTCVTDDAGSAFTGTVNRVVVTDGAGALSTSSITTANLGYLSNVTSDIQAQINAKSNASSFIDWAISGVPGIALTRINLTTPNRLIVSNASNNPVASSVISTEVGYLSGVTSSIQTQLNSKLTSFTETDPGVSAFAKTALPTCSPGEVLMSDGTTLICVTDDAGAGAFTGAVNKVVVTDGTTGALAVSSVTTAELGYLSGVTSAIQTQLNSKQATLTTATTLGAGSVQTNLQNAGEVKPYGTSAGETGEFRFYELVANGANYTGFKSPDLLSANIIYTMPGTAPNNGDVLSSTSGGVLSWLAIPAMGVTSLNGFTGAVTLTTTNISEVTNLYHTDARVLSAPITTPTLTNSAIATNDTVQVALGKLQAQVSNKNGTITAGTSAQYYRGDKTFQTLNTLSVTENSKLYYTDTRARTAAVADAIADSVTDIAPSQNAVFDSLALKANSASFIPWEADGVQLIDPSRLSIGNTNANLALATNGTGFVAAGSATSTEVGYLSGVTSAIQTQINTKLDTSAVSSSGIRSTVLTGLSLTTNAVIQASDTVIVALGYLQKQLTDRNTALISKTGGTMTSGTIGGVPNPTTANQIANKAYADSTYTPPVYTCPTNYILVPANASFYPKQFCVAKYEMKDDGFGGAASIATGGPLASVNRATARSRCQSIGGNYDLISNDQWQNIARSIAQTAVNWSGGVVASGELSRGHSDGFPNNALAASTDDNAGCTGTGQTCSSTLYDSQRRTHVLSNGSVIWDFAGNVAEWITNDSTASNGVNAYISYNTGFTQSRYGAASGTICAATGAIPYCGLGCGFFNYASGGIIRGGAWNGINDPGIFAVHMGPAITETVTTTGFRCVFAP